MNAPAATALLAALVGAGGLTTHFKGRITASSTNTQPTCATASGTGDICADGDLEANGTLDVAGAVTLTGATTITGDLACNGGAGAINTSGSGDSSVLVADNDATALLFGSTGQLNLLTLDTGDDTETVVVTGTTTTDAFHVDVGDAQFDEDVAITLDLTVTGNDIVFGNAGTIKNTTDGAITIGEASEDLIATFTSNVLTYTSSTGVAEANFSSIALQAATVATHLQPIRFCGNGSATGAADYMGPVLLDDTEADLAFGGAGCDALNNATEGNVDDAWHVGFAIKPVAMVCVGLCTGASAANDAITYQLRDDTADVTGMTCTASAWTGDASPQQCTVRDPTPQTVAAGSLLAVKTIGTDDACADAGDDFECIVYVTF